MLTQGKPPITERLSRLPHRDKLFAQTVGDRVAQATGQPLNAVIRRGLSVLTGTDMPGVLLDMLQVLAQ